VVCNRVIRARLNFKLTLKRLTPIIHVGLKLLNVRSKRDNLVPLKRRTNNRVYFIAWNLATCTLLGIPSSKQEQGTILNATSGKRCMVTRFRTIEAQS